MPEEKIFTDPHKGQKKQYKIKYLQQKRQESHARKGMIHKEAD